MSGLLGALALAVAALVPLADVAPDVRQAMRYAGPDNVLGRPLAGYTDATCRLTPAAARALGRAQSAAQAAGFTLVVLDCHRPVAASRDLMAWLQTPEDAETRARWHPGVAKADLARLGYVAPRSTHTLGDTVDATLAPAQPADAPVLDMGTPFDLFDPASAHGAPGLSAGARANRRALAGFMRAGGFVPYRREWWHYRLRSAR